MHSDPTIVSWPDYSEVYNWLCQEVKGLSDTQLDVDSQAPGRSGCGGPFAVKSVTLPG
jgi:hypothetical protein